MRAKGRGKIGGWHRFPFITPATRGTTLVRASHCPTSTCHFFPLFFPVLISAIDVTKDCAYLFHQVHDMYLFS